MVGLKHSGSVLSYARSLGNSFNLINGLFFTVRNKSKLASYSNGRMVGSQSTPKLSVNMSTEDNAAPVKQKQSRTREENLAIYGCSSKIGQKAVDIVWEAVEKTGCRCMQFFPTGEGALADGAVWCSKIGSDKAVGVQVKADEHYVVRKSGALAYDFKKVQKYAGMPVICVGIAHPLCWFIPGDDLLHLKTNVTISAFGGNACASRAIH
eukprot:GDKI01027904.1.p1 GENE.GDKI01027904.1~~GDKI01027904.1.p1  ORF type:complete len:209 (-),score=25.01 GDKI01027904.1:50-676(-)